MRIVGPEQREVLSVSESQKEQNDLGGKAERDEGSWVLTSRLSP